MPDTQGMLRILIFSLLIAPIAFAQTTRPAELAGQKPVKLIFDCDMDSDCDDAGALGILHALADRGEVEILAVMLSSIEPNSPACVDVINQYYNRPVPIGVPNPPAPMQKSKYTKAVADSGKSRYDILHRGPGAHSLYEQTLAHYADKSITIVTVGDMTNLAKLMADPRTRKLVEKKVNVWVCMGGNFIGKPAKDDLKLGNNNFTVDAISTYAAITNWPTPIVFAGREMCSVPSGLKVGKNLEKTPKENPVRIAYEAYFDGKLQDRHVADLAAVIYAVRGLGDNWDAEQTGAMDLAKDMTFTWNYENKRPMAYLLKKKPDREVEKVIDELLIAPPKAAEQK